eukprot:m.51659 g.51659  ORF g.51659 m.51659 type:complete len:466 (-) comp21481_c0_seq3:21-1418(-)
MRFIARVGLLCMLWPSMSTRATSVALADMGLGWDLLTVHPSVRYVASLTTFAMLEAAMNETFGARRVISGNKYTQRRGVTPSHRPLFVFHCRSWWWTDEKGSKDYGRLDPPPEAFDVTGKLKLFDNLTMPPYIPQPSKSRTSKPIQVFYEAFVNMIATIRQAKKDLRPVFVFDALEEWCQPQLHRWYFAEMPSAVFRNYYCPNLATASTKLPILDVALGLHPAHFNLDWDKAVENQPSWDTSATLALSSSRTHMIMYRGGNTHPSRIKLSTNFLQKVVQKHTAPTFKYKFGLRYQTDMASAAFCPVPPGHAVETFRLNEALETGCILMIDIVSLKHLEYSWVNISNVVVITNTDWTKVVLRTAVWPVTKIQEHLSTNATLTSTCDEKFQRLGLGETQAHSSISSFTCNLVPFINTVFKNKRLLDEMQHASVAWFANIKRAHHDNLVETLRSGFEESVKKTAEIET